MPEDIRAGIDRAREGLETRLLAWRPGPGAYLTSFCIGATLAQFIAAAGATTPDAVMAALTSLAAAIGVNRISDLIGDWRARPGQGPEALLQGDYAAAEQRFREFIAARDADDAGYFGLTTALLRQRQPQAALDALDQTLERTHSAWDVREAIDSLPRSRPPTPLYPVWTPE